MSDAGGYRMRVVLIRRTLSRVAALVLCTLLVIALASPRSPLSHAPLLTRALAAVVMMGVCWFTVRDLGRLTRPAMIRRLPDQTVGPLDFLLRAATAVLVAGGALAIVGVSVPTLVTTGTIGAIIVGLAAQQSLGNVIAGMVLVGVHPYHIGDRVRLQGGLTGGPLEGRVSAMGLFYTRVHVGENDTHVPNSTLLGAAITPLREPTGVDVRVRLAPGVRTADVQTALRRLTTPTKSVPHIDLEEVGDARVVVRITVAPRRASDGPRLTDELISAVAPISGDEAILLGEN